MSRRIKNYGIDSSNVATPGNDTGTRTCVGTEGLDVFCLHLITGSARVFGSLDGTTYMPKQLVLCQEPPNTGDTITAQDPVFVGAATANVPAWFFGDYKAIQVQQEGAIAITGTLSAAGEKWT